jgi:hypothetical protein
VIGSREPRAQPAAALAPWLGRLFSLLLALGLLLLPGNAGSSQALGLPGRSPRQTTSPINALATSVPSGLQEVAPPLAVQQLQEALAERQPRVEILTPADETLLPPGPWTLKLRVQDWPLVDGGPLGLGPHLVVQLDNDEPRTLTSTELTLPALTPGSHRLTVFAARPWGEAAKNPGAWRQIRLHRAAANPLALPEPGQAQLITVSPAATATAEPVLVDWLLLDAPLQNLRRDDAHWRLRLGINGADFVIDRQTPLWLNGWKPGRNAIKFELLDGRGEPLTPPYNSLVREVELNSAAPAPRWQQGRLSAAELAILLGEAAPASTASATELQINPEPAVASELRSPNPAGGPTPETGVLAGAAATTASDPTLPAPTPETGSSPGPEPATASETAPPQPAASTEIHAAPSGPLSPTAAPARAPQPSLANPAAVAATEPEALYQNEPEALDQNEPRTGPITAAEPAPEATSLPASRPAPEALTTPPVTELPLAPEPAAQPVALPEPLRPGSSSGSAAGDPVNSDGTMIQPPRRGPLAGLRERLLP